MEEFPCPRAGRLYLNVVHKTKSETLKILRLKGSTDYEVDTCLRLILENKNFADDDAVLLLQTYLDREKHPNAEKNYKEKVLQKAIKGKMKKGIEFLMRTFAHFIDEGDEKGNSIAHHLVENERDRLFKILARPDNQRAPALDTVGMENETADFVEWLIQKGVDFDQENKEGKSALLLSFEYNLQHISLVILKRTQSIHSFDRHNRSLLHLFFEGNAVQRRRYRGSVAKNNWYNVYTSRYTRCILQRLLDGRVAVVAFDGWDRTPLYIAIKENEDTSIIEMMINHLLKKDNLATIVLVELLKSCAYWDELRTEYYLNVLRDLISKGADVNSKDDRSVTPIYWAFQGKNCAAISFLDRHGVDFGAITEDNENLHHALAKRVETPIKVNDKAQEELFNLLLDKDCLDVNATTNSSGETALHYAAESGNIAIVRKLIEHGVEVDCKNANQETPLHLAVHRRAVEVAEFLLENGADVNSKDDCGRWPLLHASSSENNPMVPTLMKWGGYVNLHMFEESPFSRTIRCNYINNAQELLAYGADIHDNSVFPLLSSRQIRVDLQVLLMQHWVKLHAANLSASKKYEDIVQFKNQQRFHSECLDEIDKLKDIFICGHVSLYNFLHMNFGRRRVHMNNERLRNLLNSQAELKAQFPKYSDVVRASYYETVVWKLLLKPAKLGWLKITNIRLPGECLEPIFAYLKNDDLVKMIEYDENV